MSGSQIFSGLKRIWMIKNSIVLAYQENPRLSNAVTGFVTFTLGDVLAQKIERRKSSNTSGIDMWRSVQVGALGFVMNGVCLHYWYHTLDRVVGSCMKSKVGVATKIVVDQIIYAPFAIVVFFYFMTARTSCSIAETNERFVAKMEKSFVTTFVADCMLWPASNFVNFRFINLAYRPSFSAVIQLLWQTYLSATTATGSGSLKSIECSATAGKEQATVQTTKTSDLAQEVIQDITLIDEDENL